MARRPAKHRQEAGRQRTSPPAKRSRLERWQVLLAAAVTAFSAIAAALIASLGAAHNGSTRSDGVSEGGGSNYAPVSVAPVSISITSISEEPLPPPPGEKYFFRGTIRNWWEWEGQAQIFVIARSGGSVTSQLSTQRWLVSPPASVQTNGNWAVQWELHHPPTGALFTAAIVVLPEFFCITTEPCPTFDQILLGVEQQLARYGLNGVQTAAHSAPSAAPN